MGRTAKPFPKVLCVCQRGVIRSVGLSRRLKDKHGIEAIPVGWESSHPDTLNMLYKWADFIVVVEPYMLAKIPIEFESKTLLAPIGRDVFEHSGSPNLQRKYLEWLPTSPIGKYL